MSTPRRRICVLGTMGGAPYAGMACMHGQFLMGLARLGHEVFYIETSRIWPWHPAQWSRTNDPAYPLEFLGRTMKQFGLPEAWAYRAAYADGRWYGPLAERAVEMMKSADAVLNITGSTTPEEIGFDCNLVYIGTDPVLPELRIANGDTKWASSLAAHKAFFTYGENIGRPECPVPPLPYKTYPMRQPVIVDLWHDGPPTRPEITTIANWSQYNYDITYAGERYTWSKHHQYLKIIDLPSRTSAKLELALGLSGAKEEDKEMLRGHGWKVVDGFAISLDLLPYRNYIRSSAAELSVAKDMVARTRSGWFSERSACYLAAGRPVITQNTGFGRFLPTGAGLFAFDTAEEILAAIEAIQGDYDRHSKAALAIAQECFRAETVLAKMMEQLGL